MEQNGAQSAGNQRQQNARASATQPAGQPGGRGQLAQNDQNNQNNSDSATATATGLSCTIVGTFGEDRILGTNGPDVICGLGGDDRINAKRGNDVVYGNTYEQMAELTWAAGDKRLAGQFRRAARLAFKSAWRFQQEQGWFSVTKSLLPPSHKNVYYDWSALTNYNGYTEIHSAEAFATRLTAIPEQGAPAIVHGDYRLDNCMVDESGEVIAVLDWEICTLGDPLADLGLLMVYWTEADDAIAALPGAATTLEGFPSRAELVQAYQDAGGRPVGDLDYYVAFGYWKLACILEGVYTRYKAGAMGDDGADAEVFGDTVRLLGRASLDALDRMGG